MGKNFYVPRGWVDEIVDKEGCTGALILAIRDEEFLEVHICGKAGQDHSWNWLNIKADTLQTDFEDFITKAYIKIHHKIPKPHMWYGYKTVQRHKNLHIFKGEKTYCGLLKWDPLRVIPEEIRPIDIEEAEHQQKNHRIEDPIWFCRPCLKAYKKRHQK